MAKAKYTFNVGDEVTWHLRGPATASAEVRRIKRVKDRWCWLENDEATWNCFDRNSGLPKESPIPGFVATIRKTKGSR